MLQLFTMYNEVIRRILLYNLGYGYCRGKKNLGKSQRESGS